MHTPVFVDYGDGPECRVCGDPPTWHPTPDRRLPRLRAPISPPPAFNGRQTSVRAALLTVPAVGTLRARVVAAVGRTSRTDDELEVLLSRTHQSVSACRNRLVADGWLEPAADTDGTPILRDTRQGHPAQAWRLTPAARDTLRGAPC